MTEETVNTGKTGTNKSSNKFTMYIIIGLIALLITVMVMGTVLILTFNNLKDPKPVRTVVEHSVEEFGLLVQVGEMIINLSSEDGEEHYLKLNFSLEITKDEKVKEEMDKRVPQIRDMVIGIIRSKTKEKIDEKEGKDRLGSEIITSINDRLGSNKVKNIYFEEFLIQ